MIFGIRCLLTLFSVLTLSFSSFSRQSDTTGYYNFIQLFQPTLSTNTASIENQPLLVKNELTAAAFEFDGQEVRAIGCIKGYRGYDLVAIRSENPDNFWQADSYASYIDWLFIFKDGVLISSDTVLGTSTSGEGGEYNQSYSWNADTTLTIRSFAKEYGSSTGFELPIRTKELRRCCIDGSGTLQTIEVDGLEFSSDFFDIQLLNNHQVLCYPPHDEPWVLYSNEQLSLEFYVDKTEKNAWCTHIVSLNHEGKIVDTYAVVSSGEAPLQPPVKDVGLLDEGISIPPILIFTDRAKIQLLSNGCLHVVNYIDNS